MASCQKDGNSDCNAKGTAHRITVLDKERGMLEWLAVGKKPRNSLSQERRKDTSDREQTEELELEQNNSKGEDTAAAHLANKRKQFHGRIREKQYKQQ